MEKVSVGAATLEINIEATAATNLRPWGEGKGQEAVWIRGGAEGEGGAGDGREAGHTGRAHCGEDDVMRPVANARYDCPRHLLGDEVLGHGGRDGEAAQQQHDGLVGEGRDEVGGAAE